MSDESPELPPHYKTCKRWNFPGHFHYLTFSCFKRRPFLSKDRPRQWLATSIAKACTKLDYRLTAWVFMPEHVHLIVYPNQRAYAISDFLSAIKEPVTRQAKHFLCATAPALLEKMLDRQPSGKTFTRFWQRGGGYDRNLYTSESLWEKIDYIHRNPVRRELVHLPTDWPWSSALDYAHLRKPPIPLHLETLPWPAK